MFRDIITFTFEVQTFISANFLLRKVFVQDSVRVHSREKVRKKNNKSIENIVNLEINLIKVKKSVE